MDEIIYLESDEEITSVIDKIKNAKGVSLGLVIGREATILQSVVNLRLLLREAAALGKEIAIVTTDRIGRNLAAQVGLTVYSSIKEEKPIFTPPPPVPEAQEVIEIDLAQKEEPLPAPDGVEIHHFQDTRPVIHWKPQNKPIFEPRDTEKSVAKIHKELDPRVKKIIWPIVGVLVILAGIAFYLLYPRVTVNIFMTSEDLKKTLPVMVTSDTGTQSLEQNVFPGNLIEAFAENIQKFPATGQKNIGEKAKGSLTVYNYWESSPRTFPASTKLSNSSKTYVATASFTVPGTAIKEGNLVPGTVSINIEAESPGEEYNVKAGRFTMIGLPAAQQEKIYGTAAQDLSGGYSREVQVVSQEDYDKAKNELLGTLGTTVDKDLKNQAKGAKILEKAIVANDPEVISSSGVDQEATEFELKVRLRKQAMVFDFATFSEFLAQILERQVPSDKMVSIPSEEDYGLMVDKTAYDIKEMSLTANVSAKIISRIDADKIKTAITGKSKGAAQNYIKSQEGVDKVEFQFRPNWFPKIPELGRNVDIQIKYSMESNENSIN